MIGLVLMVLPALLGLWLVTHLQNPAKLRVSVGVLLGLSFILIGINVQARWLFFMSGMLLASIALSFLASFYSLRGLEVRRDLPARLTEGESAPVDLSITNHGRLVRRFFLLVEQGTGGGERRRRGELETARAPGVPVPCSSDIRVFVPRLDPGSRQSLRVPRLFSIRGVFSSGIITLQSGGWVGLASSTRTLSVPGTITVLPRYVESAHVPVLEDFSDDPSPFAGDRPRGSGLDFYGVREYRRGDPLRYVHWRSTARTGQLMVREFERQPGSSVNVLLLNERGCDAGPAGDTLLDNAARIAASLIRYASRSGRPFRLAFARGSRLVVEESGDFEAVLDELAGLTDESDLSPEELVGQAADAMPTGSALVLVASSRARDLSSLARAAHPGSRVGLVMLDAASFHEGELPEGLFSREALERWEHIPPPGFSFYLPFRKGDDLESCLRDSWIITSA